MGTGTVSSETLTKVFMVSHGLHDIRTGQYSTLKRNCGLLNTPTKILTHLGCLGSSMTTPSRIGVHVFSL